MRTFRFAILFVLFSSINAFAQQPIKYSSYLGAVGTGGTTAVAVGGDGAIYLARDENPSSPDVRVVKLAPTGHAILNSTLVGGTGRESLRAIAVAADGAVWVTGSTLSTDFPLVNPVQSSNPGTQGNAFIFRLAPDGATITFSTFIAATAGGSRGYSLVADADGSVVLAGTTCGAGLATTPGAIQGTFHGGCDAFITRFSAAGGLQQSTYLGGTGVEEWAVVALGPQGDVYVAGTTQSTDMPTTVGAFQTTPGGSNCLIGTAHVPCTDGFIARLSPDETQLRFLTYLRDEPSDTATFSKDYVKAIAVGASGDVYVTGATHSGNRFPTTPNAYRTTCARCGSRGAGPLAGNGEAGDVFVTRLNASGTSLVYSTFLGGSLPAPSAGQIGLGIVVDGSGRAHVVGETSSTDFPTVFPYQSESTGHGDGLNPRTDAFLSKLSADGGALESSTFLGGALDDRASSVAVAGNGTVWLAGSTDSVDLPTTSDALQTSSSGGPTGFVSAFMLPAPLLWIDVPTAGNVTAPFQIGGWAIDRASMDDAGIDAVHVWAYPNPGSGAAPIFLGTAGLGYGRSDVGALFGAQFANAGWTLTVDSLSPGTYLLAVFGHSDITETFSVLATRTVTLDSRPLLTIDRPVEGATESSPLFIGGWAIDRGAASGPGMDAVHVWAYPDPGSGTSPVFLGVATYGVSRPDVGAVFGSQFTASGYDLRTPVAPGTYLLAVFGHSTVTNSFVVVATRVVTVTSSSPR